jgi:hypothetical protein
MDGQQCDRHPSARAQARILFPSLNLLYFCAHCANKFQDAYDGAFHITYQTVSV